MSIELLPINHRFVCPNCGIWVSKINIYRPGGCRCGQCDNHIHTAQCKCEEPFEYESEGKDSMYNWEFDLEEWIEEHLND